MDGAWQAERDKKIEEERRQELQRKIKEAQRRERQKEEEAKRLEQTARVRNEQTLENCIGVRVALGGRPLCCLTDSLRSECWHDWCPVDQPCGLQEGAIDEHLVCSLFAYASFGIKLSRLERGDGFAKYDDYEAFRVC